MERAEIAPPAPLRCLLLEALAYPPPSLTRIGASLAAKLKLDASMNRITQKRYRARSVRLGLGALGLVPLKRFFDYAADVVRMPPRRA